MRYESNSISKICQLKMGQGKVNLKKFKDGVNKWLHLEDGEVLDVILASMVSEKVGGDPLWLFLIAPPGGTKTELLRCFSGEDFYHLSDMTSKTLISGLMLGTGENRRKIKDLLPQLDGKVLIFKDFTTILEKSKDERREIISQFREAYDGSFSKKVGTVDEKISYESRFGLIAGVTPVIDKHWKLMQQLGERFLKIRLNEDTDAVTSRAEENEGKEREMRKELLENAERFISTISYDTLPNFDKKYSIKVQKMAKFVAIARTPISFQGSASEFYFEQIPTPEVPTRIVKQLKKLAKCLALVRGKSEIDEEELDTLLRVSEDTLPPDRMAILRIIRQFHNETITGCSRTKIGKILRIPETSLRRILEQLKALDLIIENIHNDSYGNFQGVSYQLTAIYEGLFGTLPEKAGEAKGGEIELRDAQQTAQKLTKLTENQQIAMNPQIKYPKEEGVHIVN